MRKHSSPVLSRREREIMDIIYTCRRATAEEVRAALVEAGFRAELDARGESVGKRIRDGELAKVPYLLIVGDKEAESGTVSARRRGEGDLGAMAPDELLARFASEIDG